MNFGVDGTKIDGWYPALIRLEREPHDAADNVRVYKDQEGVVQHLHHGFVLNRDGHISDLLQNLLETQGFKKRHDVGK